MTTFPCWVYAYPEYTKQYQACWIMGIIPGYEKHIAGTPFHTLLPIRFYDYGSWDYDEKTKFGLLSVGCYRDGIQNCMKSHVVLAEYLYAKRLWEEASMIIYKEFPEIENIVFEQQRSDGVYLINFRYDPSQIGKRQQEIMRQLIDDGFCIQEELSVRCEESNERKTWIYEGTLDCSFELLQNAFHRASYGQALPLVANRSVSFSYDTCEAYYHTFDRDLLELGNQRRWYAIEERKQKGLFEAARQGDYTGMCKLVETGYSLNAFDKSGTTAFTWFALQQITREEPDNDRFKQWDHLIALGANPGLFGVNTDNESLLTNAILDKDVEAVRYLLDIGVNPNYYIYLDDCFTDEGVTLLEQAEDWREDWRIGRDVEGDADSIEKEYKKMDEICRLLRR